MALSEFIRPPGRIASIYSPHHEAVAMTKIRSLFLNYNSEPKLGESLVHRLRNEPYTTETISAPDTDPNKLEIAFVMTDPEAISFCCLAERRARISTYRVRLKLTDAFYIEGGRVDAIQESLSKASNREVNLALARPSGIISEATTTDLVATLSEIDAGFRKKFNHLIQILDQQDDHDDSNAATIFEQERDAIGIALQIFDPTKREELRQARWSSKSAERFGPISALRKFKEPNEDEIVYHDLTHFPGMKAFEESFDARIFRNRNRELHVVHANRTKIERALGVDLVYINSQFNSFVAVQYKKINRIDLSEDGSAWHVRIDQQWKKELSRMRSAHNAMHTAKPSVDPILGYRLARSGFLFKLCDCDEAPKSLSSLAEGYYVPLDLWDLIEANILSTGPRGGSLLTGSKLTRYLSNTQFCDLVRDGLLGEIFKDGEDLEKVITAALEGQRSVIYAHERKRPRPEDTSQELSADEQEGLFDFKIPKRKQ